MTAFFNPLNIPCIKDFLVTKHGIIYNNKGIDSMSYRMKTRSGLEWIQSLGYEEVQNYEHTPIYQSVKSRLEREKEIQKGYKKGDFEPLARVFKYGNDKGLLSYLIIYTNIEETFEEAKKQKKAKDTFCVVELHGLHQPTKNITIDNMRMLSRLLKRKAMKIQSVDIAEDFSKHHKVNHTMKKHINDKLHVLSTSKGSTVYINDTKMEDIAKIKYYDKYMKQTEHQEQELDPSLKDWKRLEVRIEIPREFQKSASEYFNSTHFQEKLKQFDEISSSFGAESQNDYLNYQLNTLCDSRGLNNKDPNAQFNSVEELEKFKNKETIRKRNFTQGIEK